MSDKLEKEINLYDKIIVKNYNTLSLAEQFEKGVVVKVDDELAILKQQLTIAVEQLKDTYAICFRNRDTLLHTPEHNIIGGIERDCAIALQKIEELNNV